MTCDMPHRSAEAIASLITHQLDFRCCPGWLNPELLPPASHAALPLWVASVVPEQTRLWQDYRHTRVVTLDQVPLQGRYPTLGIDRALALWGAIQRLGAPVLVVDAGTALTLTGANAAQQLVGGAILPGLQLQLRSLAQHTAALPFVTPDQQVELPQRWATSTPDAIYSGILYTLLAGLKDFIQAWRQPFPEGAIAFTGGDGAVLLECLTLSWPDLTTGITVEPSLIFDGMQAIWQQTQQAASNQP